MFQEQKPRVIYVGLVFSQNWGRGKKVSLPPAGADVQNSAGVHTGCSSAAWLLLWSLLQKINIKKGKEKKKKSPGDHSLSSENVDRPRKIFLLLKICCAHAGAGSWQRGWSCVRVGEPP